MPHKGRGPWPCARITARGCGAPGGQAEPPSSMGLVRNVGSPSLSRQGQGAVRPAEREAGRGRRQKRTPSCHGLERSGASGHLTPRASALTAYAGLASRASLGKRRRRQSRGQPWQHRLVRAPAPRWTGRPCTGRRPIRWDAGSTRVACRRPRGAAGARCTPCNVCSPRRLPPQGGRGNG